MEKDKDITEIIKLMAHEVAQPGRDIDDLAGCYRLIIKCCHHELTKPDDAQQNNEEAKIELIRQFHHISRTINIRLSAKEGKK